MFCRNCGKELNDEAVVCVGCGCAVNGTKNAVKPKTATETVGKKTANYESIIGFVLSLIGGFFNIACMASQPFIDENGYIHFLGAEYLVWVFIFINSMLSVSFDSFSAIGSTVRQNAQLGE